MKLSTLTSDNRLRSQISQEWMLCRDGAENILWGYPLVDRAGLIEKVDIRAPKSIIILDLRLICLRKILCS